MLDGFDESDLLRDVVGGLAQRSRKFNSQQFQIIYECLGVERRNVPRALAGAPRALFHLVFAVVTVRHKMPHVGDVHDVIDAVAIEFQNAFQAVFKQEGAVVANVLIVIHRRAAGVEANLARFQWRKFAL